MTIRNFCSSFTLCCIITILTITILLSLGLAFNDISHRGEVQEALETVLSTPINQLRCLEVCRSWYSTDCGEQCCDRYNSNICAEKGQCKAEYVYQQKIALQILEDDTKNELIIVFVCLIVLAALLFLKSRRNQSSNQLTPQIQLYISQTICKVVQNSTLKSSQNEILSTNISPEKISAMLNIFPALYQDIRNRPNQIKSGNSEQQKQNHVS